MDPQINTVHRQAQIFTQCFNTQFLKVQGRVFGQKQVQNVIVNCHEKLKQEKLSWKDQKIL